MLTIEILSQEGYFVCTSRTTVEDGDENMVLWGVKTLINKFHELTKNKLYYSRIGYLKNDRAEELKQVSVI